MDGELVIWGSAYLYAAMVGLLLALAALSAFLPGRTSAIQDVVVGVPLGASGLLAVVSEVAEGALRPHVTPAEAAVVITLLIVGLSIALLCQFSRPRSGRPGVGGRLVRNDPAS